MLLEREPVLDELGRLLAMAAAGHGSVVAVCGEAGAGKTAVLEQFRRNTAGAAQHRIGLCDPLTTPRPLGPLMDVAHQAPGPLQSAVSSGAGREQLFGAFLAELGVRPPPAVVTIEDLHWADDATLDLLRYVGRRIHGTGGMLMLTYRDDEAPPEHRLRTIFGDLPRNVFRRIVLPPLSEASVHALAHNAGRSSTGLYQLTGGNPFFVTELLAAGTGVVPGSVHDAVIARAARLPRAVRGMLDIVSVIPGRAESWLLEKLGASPEWLTGFGGTGMLVAGPGFVSFRHELARRAWLATLDATKCALLHQRVLDVLMSPEARTPSAARLAHHAAGADQADAVLRLAPQAAREASAVGAHREAVAHYRSALAHADRLPPDERAALLEALSYELHFIADIAGAVEAISAALAIRRQSGAALEEGSDLRWLSRLAWFHADRDAALTHGRAAAAVLQPLGTSRELAMAYSNLSQLHMLAEENDDAVHWGERAIEMAEEIGDAEVLAHALINTGAAELASAPSDDDVADGAGASATDRSRGMRLLERSLALSLEHGFQEHASRAHTVMACRAVENRDYAAARASLSAGIQYARQRDIDTFADYLTGWRARLHLECGAWVEARADADEVLAGDVGVRSIIRFPAVVAAGLHRIRCGDAAGEAMLQDAFEFAMQSGELQRIGPACLGRAEAAWIVGDGAALVSVAQAGYAVALKHSRPWYTAGLEWWLVQAGCAPERPSDVASPYLLQLEGRWQEAATEWEKLGCPYERALALAPGDAAARHESIALLQSLGADGTLRALRRDLRRRGVRDLPRGATRATRSNAAGLTRSQMKVLALLGEGLTSREIAGRLFLSVRTVDHHVADILARLGAPSRSQAVDAARTLGLLPTLPHGGRAKDG